MIRERESGLGLISEDFRTTSRRPPKGENYTSDGKWLKIIGICLRITYLHTYCKKVGSGENFEKIVFLYITQ